MRTSTQILLVVTLVLFCTVSTYAQEALWKELDRKSTMLYSQGRHSEAVQVTEEALTVAEKTFGPDHPAVAQSLNNLGLLYKDQGKYAEAEPLFKRSLEIYEKALGPDHPWMATVCENMAELYKKIGKEDEAERLEARARKIRKGENKTDITSGWSVNTYGFAVYIRGQELLSGLITAFISCIVLLTICSGLSKFFERTTRR